MRQIEPYRLWIGNTADARNVSAVLAAGITAVVDLAGNETPVSVTRELAYCRFPLMDGGVNEDWLVRTAVETTTAFLRRDVPTLICCSAGMSRSPAIAAAALALVEGRSPRECLALVVQKGASDVSPFLWDRISRLVQPS